MPHYNVNDSGLSFIIIRRPALTPTGRSSFAGPGVMTLEKLAPLNSF